MKSYLSLLLAQFEDKTLKVLLIAATFTLIIGLFNQKNPYAWIEGASIYFAVAFIAWFAASNEYLKEKQF